MHSFDSLLFLISLEHQMKVVKIVRATSVVFQVQTHEN